MAEHDTNTAMPKSEETSETSEHLAQQKSNLSTEPQDLADRGAVTDTVTQLPPTDEAQADGSDSHLASAENLLPTQPSPSLQKLQGSGAVAAGHPVALTVSAADPKAFGASLEDIANGRVKVNFTS